ncbi:putative E3 ubiquitin-protein ligase XERICO [Bienertia sinuspersici]
MGLSNFPSPAEGVLPILVMNTVMSVAILKNLLRSVLQLMGAVSWVSRNIEENQTTNEPNTSTYRLKRMRGISITQFKCLCDKSKSSESSNNDSDIILAAKPSIECSKPTIECCVCLCKFEDEDEVSQLSCKHFFHRNCLEKWFDNHHTTCPLCRSIH